MKLGKLPVTEIDAKLTLEPVNPSEKGLGAELTASFRESVH